LKDMPPFTESIGESATLSRMGYWATKNVVGCFDGKQIQTM